MPCVNEKKCHDNCSKCDELIKIEEALNRTIERIYEHKAYNCAGYMCTVATTCYEPEEEKRICTGCLKSRFLGGES